MVSHKVRVDRTGDAHQGWVIIGALLVIGGVLLMKGGH